MRAFLFLIMILVAYDCTPQQLREKQPDLFGKVKTLKETTCEAKDVFGKVTKGNIISKSIYKYDENGKEIEWSQYNSADSLIGKETFKYDESGNGIEWNWWAYDGNQTYKITYAFENTIPSMITEREIEYYE